MLGWASGGTIERLLVLGVVPVEESGGILSEDSEQQSPVTGDFVQPALEKLRAAVDGGDLTVDQGFTLVEEIVVRSGPLPSPEELAAFDAVLPGLAETMVAMWQQELSHHVYLDAAEQNRLDRQLEIEARQTNLGMWMGFVLIGVPIVLLILLAGLALFLGKDAYSFVGIVPSAGMLMFLVVRVWRQFVRR